MTRPPPRSTRTDKLFPYTTLFRFLARLAADLQRGGDHVGRAFVIPGFARIGLVVPDVLAGIGIECNDRRKIQIVAVARAAPVDIVRTAVRSEEHTSELQSLMRISYAVFCLQKKILSIIFNFI